jgi:hypothetical protein
MRIEIQDKAVRMERVMRGILEMARSLGLEAHWDGEKIVLSAPREPVREPRRFVRA